VTRSPLSSHIGYWLLRRIAQTRAQCICGTPVYRCPEGPFEAVATFGLPQAIRRLPAEPRPTARTGLIEPQGAFGLPYYPDQRVGRLGLPAADAGPCRGYAGTSGSGTASVSGSATASSGSAATSAAGGASASASAEAAVSAAGAAGAASGPSSA
jgi:hypothetical protein